MRANTDSLRQVRVLFLIARTDVRARERTDLGRAIRLRDDISAGKLEGVELVGPEQDTDPTSWSDWLRRSSGTADVAILEGHGWPPDPDDGPRCGYQIGAGGSTWQPACEFDVLPRPSFELVVLGSCWAGNHVDHIAEYFNPGQRFIASTGKTVGGDVERIYRPVLKTMTRCSLGDAVPRTPWGSRRRDDAAAAYWTITPAPSAGSTPAWVATAGKPTLSSTDTVASS